MKTPARFTKRIYIKAPAKKIYELWCTQKGMEKWFLRKAEFIKADGSLRKRKNNCSKGDTYVWMWHGYGDEVAEKNKILEANGKDKIKFLFSVGCHVTVTLKEENKLTLVELTQNNFPKNKKQHFDYFNGCSTGWTFYLANMKSIVEGGIDLRNKNMEHKSVIN